MSKIWHVELMSDCEVDGWRSGHPGAWQVEKHLSVHLPDASFDGMDGEQYCFSNHHLIIGRGFEWDGSSGVYDTIADGLPSLVHDIICGAIEESSLAWWRKWKLRRVADKWYALACDLRGMWGIRAGVRFWGLRLCNPAYRMWKKIRGIGS